MVAILKLRWIKLRDDIKLIGIMTGMTLIMIAVFAGISFTTQDTDIAFVDEDKSELSERVLKELNSQDGYHFEVLTLDEAEKAVKNGNVSGGFYLEKGFQKAVQTGQVTIQKLLVAENMGNMQMDQLIQTAIDKAIQDNQLIEALSIIIDKDVEENVTEFIDEHWQYKRPIQINAKSLTEETPYDSTKHSIVGFSLFFAMFTIIFGISDILMEKEQHTWQRQLVSPISKGAMLSGNLLMIFMIGFVQVSSIFLISRYLFKIDLQGSPFVLLLLIGVFVFCVTAMGMFLSNFVNTMGQLSAIAPVIITGTAMLGGSFWPLEIVSNKFLLALSTLTPQRWGINAIEKIVIHGSGLSEIYTNIMILMLMGIVYLGLGVYLLEKKPLSQ